MAKSDKLINAYLANLSTQQQEAELLENTVRTSLMAQVGSLLHDWLGEFADELTVDGKLGKGGWYYEANRQASIKLGVEWNGIHGGILLGAGRKDAGVAWIKHEQPTAELSFTFPSCSFRYSNFRQEWSYRLGLDCSKPFIHQDGWVLPIHGEKTEPFELGSFLTNVVNELQIRAAASEKDAQRMQDEKADELRKAIKTVKNNGDLQSIVEEAVHTFPELEDEWLKLTTEAFIRFEAEEEAKEKYYGEVEQIKEWLLDWLAVLETNRATLKAIQDDYRKPFNVYRLTYGIAALDDDGEKFVETREIYIRGANPFTAGSSYHVIPADVTNPAQDVIIFSPVKAELLEFDIENAPHGLLRSTWVKPAFKSLKVPVLVDSITYQVEISEAAWQSFPPLEPWMIRHAGWPGALRPILDKYQDDGNYFDIYRERKDLFEQDPAGGENQKADEFPF